MLELSAVTKIYNEGKPNEVVAVAGVDLALPPNSVTVLRGSSGSGKTTLLTLIGSLARPTSGRVTLDGEALSGLPDKFMADVRRRTFGFVFQRFNLIPGLTALQNVIAPAYPLGPPYRELRARAMALMERLGVAHRATFVIDNLSGGETQRMAIARALINDPKFVIADEPTANLDSALAGQFLVIVSELKKDGRSVLIASHDPRVWQSAVVDRVVEMRDGLIAGGSP